MQWPLHNRPCPTPPTAQPEPQRGECAPRARPRLRSRPDPRPRRDPVPPDGQSLPGSVSPWGTLPLNSEKSASWAVVSSKPLLRSQAAPPAASAHTCAEGAPAQTLSEPRALPTRGTPLPPTDPSAGALPCHPEGQLTPITQEHEVRQSWAGPQAPRLSQEAPSPSVSPTKTSSSSRGGGGMGFGGTAPGSGRQSPLHPSSPGARAGLSPEPGAQLGQLHPPPVLVGEGEALKAQEPLQVGGGLCAPRRLLASLPQWGSTPSPRPEGSWASGGLRELASPAEADQTQGPLKGGELPPNLRCPERRSHSAGWSQMPAQGGGVISI